MEPVTVVAALGAVNHVANLAKALGSIIKESGKVEGIEKLIELQSAILELQQKHAEMFNENQALREENHLLKKHQDLRSELKFTDGVYLRQRAGHPEYYCSVCLDKDGKYIQIPRIHSQSGPVWICRACNSEFYQS